MSRFGRLTYIDCPAETRPDPLPSTRSPASVFDPSPAPTQSPQGVGAEDRRRTAWVNEFHYNNTGKDEDEVNICIPDIRRGEYS